MVAVSIFLPVSKLSLARRDVQNFSLPHWIFLRTRVLVRFRFTLTAPVIAGKFHCFCQRYVLQNTTVIKTMPRMNATADCGCVSLDVLQSTVKEMAANRVDFCVVKRR